MSDAGANSWLVWALLAAVFAAATAVFAKLGVEGVDADFATLVRTSLVLVVLAPFVVLTGKWTDPAGLSGRTWLFLALSALATGASWVCYFRALRYGPVSLVAPIDKLSVVLAAVFAVVFLRERPSFQEWIGIGLIASGVLVVAAKR